MPSLHTLEQQGDCGVKEPSKRNIEKDCLDLWSKCVRTKQRVCRICGSTYRPQGHHIRGRGNASTRYDLQNGLCICAKCHCLQKFNSERFQDLVISVIGEAEYKRLKMKSLQTYKWTVEELKDLKSELRMILRDLEDEYGVLIV